jgi:hypothetical protein
MRDRAVSDLVGFVLVFSLITMTVGVVYVAGFTGLEDARDAERVNNAERAFDVLAHNVEDSDRSGAPGRSTEIKLSEAEIGFGNRTNVSVTLRRDTNDNGTYDDNTTTYERSSPIVYEAAGTRIVYENGAVIREQGDGAVMRRDPSIVFRERDGERSTVLSIVDLNQRSGGQVAGSTTVLVRTRLQSGPGARTTLLSTPRTLDDGGNPDEVVLNITTTAERAPVWKRYVEENVGWGIDCEDPDSVATGTAVVCTFETDRLLVRSTHVDARISS